MLVFPRNMVRLWAFVLMLTLGNAAHTSARLTGIEGCAPRPAPITEAISSELGLIDITVGSVPEAERGMELAFDDRGQPSVVNRVAMRRTPGPDGDVWKCRLMRAPTPGEAGWVTFWLRAVGEEDRAWTGPFRASTSPGAGLAPPPWALGAVWYQVFPDRFANGNPRNDPTGSGVHRRRWGSSWEEVDLSEVEAAWARAEGAPGRFRFDPRQPVAALYNVATARRYGGDLEGVLGRLDDLADLGVTAIYLNPIFDAPSMHKYDAADYRHVDQTLAGDDPTERPAGETLDPATWVWTAADRYLIDTLLPAAHDRGMRLVLDGVWNHTSTQFWAFRDIERNGASSPYAGWYDARFEGGRLSGWRGWNAWNGSLPQFARGVDGNIVEPVRRHVADITRRWMDPDGDGNPSDGIDGWRLDVARDIPAAFWREWCPLVRDINPGAVTVGEVWSIEHEIVGGGLLDAQTNYPFAIPAVRWLDGREGFGSRELGQALAAAGEHPAALNLAQMNLLGSHDTARIATMLNNPGRGYGGQEKARAAEDYRTGRPSPEVYDLVVLGVALQATWPGAAMVYGGDEWGVYGADDPDDRKPVPWPDLGPYENPDAGPDAALRARFREWLRLRHDPVVGPILRYGDVEWVETGSPDVVAYVRSLNSIHVLIVLNRGPSAFGGSGLPADLAWEGSVPARSAVWRRLQGR